MKWMLLFIWTTLFSCHDIARGQVAVQTIESQKLDRALAKHLFELPVHCLAQEYPNKLGQVLGSSLDLKTPRELRPVFYGCFDWHSSVHGYWSIVKLLTVFPELDQEGSVRQLLEEHITVEKVQIEKAFFLEEHNASFERTYGWAWLLMLQKELSLSQDEQFKKWGKTLQPLTNLIVERYMVYLPKLVYPIRAGQHDNSAFSLVLALDYARALGNKEFEKLVEAESKRLFLKDVRCDLSYEPSGYDFLSPCLEEALLFSKILPSSDYRLWLGKFLPELFDANFIWIPAKVSDRTDGKLVHLDGLNFSRANCLLGIAKVLPELDHLQVIAKQHFDYSIKNLANDDYMGSHWLGTFAIYSVLNN